MAEILKLGCRIPESVLREYLVATGPMKLAILFAFAGFVCGVEYSILNISKCSSSGKTATVDYCHVDASHKAIVLSFTVHEKVTKLNVRLQLLVATFYLPF